MLHSIVDTFRDSIANLLLLSYRNLSETFNEERQQILGTASKISAPVRDFEKRERTLFHEAAHLMVGMENYPAKLEYISVATKTFPKRPHVYTPGIIFEKDYPDQPREEAQDSIQKAMSYFMASQAAEVIQFGNFSKIGVSGDHDQANLLAHQLLHIYGLSNGKTIEESSVDEISAEMDAMRENALQIASNVLKDNWDKVNEIVEKLRIHSVLAPQDFGM